MQDITITLAMTVIATAWTVYQLAKISLVIIAVAAVTGLVL